jgi:hypothetical protein
VSHPKEEGESMATKMRAAKKAKKGKKLRKVKKLEQTKPLAWIKASFD